MNANIERAGTFRGQIVSYGLYEAKSSALAVQITVRLDEFWNGASWDDWRGYETQQAEGFLWIIKKDGSEHQSQIEALIQHAGWDASIPSIASNEWKPTPCQVVVEEDAPNEYHADTRYKIAWLNGYDQQVTANNVDTERAKALQARHGARLRALAGNVQRNTPTPEGKPLAPPKPSGGITDAEAKAEGAKGNDGIPF